MTVEFGEALLRFTRQRMRVLVTGIPDIADDDIFFTADE
jgi:hypothetical protein